MRKRADSRRQTAAEEVELRSTKFLLPSAVRRLPSSVRAWIGSILFHTLLVLFILFWFSLPGDSDRGMPGERTAVGSIVLQASGGGQQQVEETADDRQQTATEGIELERFADINLTALPVTPALAPGQEQSAAQSGVAQPGGASAADLAEAFQPSVGIGAGIGNQTGEATVQFFGQGGTGTRFVYVLDRSASMEGTPIRVAKAELIRSLNSLEEHHQFNIIYYSGRNNWQLWQSGRRLLFATEQNKQNATRFVESIMADGGTRHFEPLMEAIRHRPDVIFFLTDGEVQDDLTPVELSNIDRENSRFGRGAQIHVIQFGSGGLFDSPSRSLQRLATDNHGEHQYINVLLLR